MERKKTTKFDAKMCNEKKVRKDLCNYVNQRLMEEAQDAKDLVSKTRRINKCISLIRP